MRRLLLAAVAALVLNGAAAAQDAPAPEDGDANRLRMETERVVVFKDGYCLVVRSAVGRSNDAGEVFTDDVPDSAVLGSFWATPDAGRLLSMTAGVEGVEGTTTETVVCADYLQLLAANEGKAARIELDGGIEVSGTLRGVLASTIDQPQPAPGTFYAPWQPATPATSSVSVLSGSLFALTTADGDVVLPVSRIRGLTVVDMEIMRERTTTTKSSRKRLTFKFEGGAADRTLRIMYFRPGVRWIPTYRIGLSSEPGDDKRAELRLQAEILNEAEDLVNVPFDLVVGVPNFRFKEVVSPFVLEQTLHNALAQAAPQLMGQQMLGGGSNAMFSNRAGEWRGGAPAGPAAAAGIPSDIAADRSHDLFVYSLPPMTLRRGERAAVPVFVSEVPYRDVYTWDVHLQRADVEAAPSGRDASPLTLSGDRIWHQIELTNTTDVPWTTGASLLLDGVQPLGQELMTYTASGGRVRVPVTVAIDLRGDVAEEERERNLNVLQWMNQRYARIDKAAKLTVTSYKDADVDVEIRCRLGGHADAATPSGEIALGTFEADDWVRYQGHPAVNNHSDVTFELRIGPRESVMPEILFHYFTRH